MTALVHLFFLGKLLFYTAETPIIRTRIAPIAKPYRKMENNIYLISWTAQSLRNIASITNSFETVLTPAFLSGQLIPSLNWDFGDCPTSALHPLRACATIFDFIRHSYSHTSTCHGYHCLIKSTYRAFLTLTFRVIVHKNGVACIVLMHFC